MTSIVLCPPPPQLETLPHIRIEVIWSDVQTRVGRPHKVLEQFGWGHRTSLKEKAMLGFRIHVGAERLRSRVGGRLVGWSNVILNPTLALIRALFGFRIQDRAECDN